VFAEVPVWYSSAKGYNH